MRARGVVFGKDNDHWTRFDMTDGDERDVSVAEVRAACVEIGVKYRNALMAGHVRCGCFEYELVDEDP